MLEISSVSFGNFILFFKMEQNIYTPPEGERFYSFSRKVTPKVYLSIDDRYSDFTAEWVKNKNGKRDGRGIGFSFGHHFVSPKISSLSPFPLHKHKRNYRTVIRKSLRKCVLFKILFAKITSEMFSEVMKR